MTGAFATRALWLLDDPAFGLERATDGELLAEERHESCGACHLLDGVPAQTSSGQRERQ